MKTQLPDSVLLVLDGVQIGGRLITQQRLRGPIALPGRPDGPFTYANLFAARYQQNPEPGMSGALVLAATGELVGMHVAGIDDTGYFHLVNEILSQIGMVLYRS